MERWDTNNAGYRAIFNAALAGITANPAFFGPIMQGDPAAAVAFADQVVVAAIEASESALLSPAAPDAGWRSVKDAPQDGSPILLNHRVHGVIQGWFSKGEWTDDTPISPREYTGDMWILGDDLAQDEVEFGEHGEVLGGSVMGWLPLSALQPGGER